jgi:hypothetical protein
MFLVLLGDAIACDVGQAPIVSLGPCCVKFWNIEVKNAQL